MSFSGSLYKHSFIHSGFAQTDLRLTKNISYLSLFLGLLTGHALFGPSILPNYIWKKSTACLGAAPPLSNIDNKNETWSSVPHTETSASVARWVYLPAKRYTSSCQDSVEEGRVGGGGSQTGTPPRERGREGGGMDGNSLFCYSDLYNDHQVAASICFFFPFPFTVSRIYLQIRRAWWWWWWRSGVCGHSAAKSGVLLCLSCCRRGENVAQSHMHVK